MKIAVVGAGIYGALTALEFLKDKKNILHLFDPRGFFHGASSINQFRIHRGYHYPRSQPTIDQIEGATDRFNEMFNAALISPQKSYYAIARDGSKTSSAEFELFCDQNKLSLSAKKPSWINYDRIESIFEVEESLYNPQVIRAQLLSVLSEKKFQFEKRAFTKGDVASYDLVIYCTYGINLNGRAFSQNRKIQLVEKIKIELPKILRGKSLVILDGEFTAFDPLPEDLSVSQFGSSKFTTHEIKEDIKEFSINFRQMINRSEFQINQFTNFYKMRDHASLFVPSSVSASYLGSKFTYRVVEKDSETDERLVELSRISDNEVAILSGKIVSAAQIGEKIKLFCDKL